MIVKKFCLTLFLIIFYFLAFGEDNWIELNNDSHIQNTIIYKRPKSRLPASVKWELISFTPSSDQTLREILVNEFGIRDDEIIWESLIGVNQKLNTQIKDWDHLLGQKLELKLPISYIRKRPKTK